MGSFRWSPVSSADGTSNVAKSKELGFITPFVVYWAFALKDFFNIPCPVGCVCNHGCGAVDFCDTDIGFLHFPAKSFSPAKSSQFLGHC